MRGREWRRGGRERGKEERKEGGRTLKGRKEEREGGRRVGCAAVKV